MNKKTIHNPILKGFCPDPSITRAGNDYYIATSTFEWWPGVRLWHSNNLSDWEQIKSPLWKESQLNLTGNPNNCGIWAPCLSYYKKRFYLVYTDVKTQKRPYYNTHNYLVWTDDINSEWSERVYLNSTGFDPSLFHDDDGKKYLLNMRNGFKGILLQEYDEEKHELKGEIYNIFGGTQAGYTEGPHLYKKNGWYYLFCAEGGTGYEHQETIARSKVITGPYEVYKEPLITSMFNSAVPLQKAGHGQLVETPSGEPYLVHLCARPITIPKSDDCPSETKRSILGRETAIQKMEWTADGWIRNSTKSCSPEIEIPCPVGYEDKRIENEIAFDDFNKKELDVCYSFLRKFNGDDINLTQRKGFLRLYGRESITSMHNVTLAARRITSIYCNISTKMEFKPNYSEQAAGLCLIYNNENFYLFFMSVDDNGQKYLSLLKINKGIYKNADPTALGKLFITNDTVFLKAELRGNTGQFLYSYDGKVWKKAFEMFDLSLLSDEYACGFTGTNATLYCHDMTGSRKYADFDFFEISNLS